MKRAGSAIGAMEKGLGAAAAAGLAVQYLPSVAVLGQWSSVHRSPGGWCHWQGPAGRRQVALTFDDGPHPEGTPAVLDRLDELGLRATFFLLGGAVARHPALVGEITRRGHEVGTHGYTHGRHLARTPWWVAHDLGRAAAALATAGHQPRWYRPSYGQATASTFVAARRRGWRLVLWSSWGREWATPHPAAVAARVAHRLGSGAIVLLHDSDAHGPAGMWRTARDALGPIAAELDRRGLGTATLGELLRREP
ncbi:MAG: polysaccharide deacetylase family protein [Acidimicrobiales bacterium]